MPVSDSFHDNRPVVLVEEFTGTAIVLRVRNSPCQIILDSERSSGGDCKMVCIGERLEMQGAIQSDIVCTSKGELGTGKYGVAIE